MRAGCITGDRINGLVDGVLVHGTFKFDLLLLLLWNVGFQSQGLLVEWFTRDLPAQLGRCHYMNASNVVNFVDDGNKVTVELENGQKYEGDVLIGADGIWSKVRRAIIWAQRSCLLWLYLLLWHSDFVPADIETVGYRVFLGHKQYFVSQMLVLERCNGMHFTRTSRWC